MKLILFNGPPGSGKDTLGRALRTRLEDLNYQVIMEKFAKPIKDMGKALFGWDDEKAAYYFETREGKDTTIPGTQLTYRQLLIDISEDFIKPRFGKEAFGNLLTDRLIAAKEAHKANGLRLKFAIITDCGFKEEVVKPVNQFETENCFLIRIHRDGCDFKSDSRSYIDLAPWVLQMDLDNNGTVDEAVDQVMNKMWSS